MPEDPPRPQRPGQRGALQQGRLSDRQLELRRAVPDMGHSIRCDANEYVTCDNIVEYYFRSMSENPD